MDLSSGTRLKVTQSKNIGTFLQLCSIVINNLSIKQHLYFIVDVRNVVLEISRHAETLRALVARELADVEVDEVLVLFQAVPVVELLTTD